jgi:hypothetical protein
MLLSIFRRLINCLRSNKYDYSHTYYTNGILSHNTETTCAYLLWYAIFHSDKTILVVSNKSANAKEMIGKIQYAYEELPEWLKPGIDDASWNKHECSFDNKSRILAQATSTDSGRGFAISLLYCLDGESSNITVRNKKTGQIENLSLIDFFHKIHTIHK